MSLPNLSNLSNLSKLSLEDAKCKPCGVTKQSFSFLLPGLTPSPGQPEPVFDEKDYVCQICAVHLNYPSEGFIPSDGEIYQLQDAFDDYQNQTQTEEEKQRFHDAACVAADKIRKSNPRRTQVELLLPGCGHQFHKLCLQKQVMSRSPLRKQCPICKTPIHSSILADLKGESGSSGSSSAAPRGLVRERSAASTIPESDDEDDEDEDGDGDEPRAQVPRPAPWFPLPDIPDLPDPPPPIPEAPGMDANNAADIAQAVQQYFNDLGRPLGDLANRLEAVTGPFATDESIRFAREAIASLRYVSRQYRNVYEDRFADFGSLIHIQWDEEIGNIIFAYHFMYTSFYRFNEGIEYPYEGSTNINFMIVLFQALIRALVPPSEINNPIAYSQLETTWRYQIDVDSGFALDGGTGPESRQLHLFREIVFYSRDVQNDVRMQPITGFMTTLNNRRNIPENTRRTFVLLTTMLQAAMKEAILNQFTGGTGQLVRFHEDITEHLNALVNDDGNGNVINMREEFRVTVGNALEAITQQ